MNYRPRKNKFLISRVLILIFSIGILFGSIYGIKYICYRQENKNMPIYEVQTDDKKISLSFDVAWGSNNIDEILDILDKHNVKATFFLVGSWIDDNSELVKKIHKRGHEIGNHSNTHADTKELSKKAITDEINITSNKIYKLIGEKTSLYRPPFGKIDNKTMEVCSSLGYKVIRWSIDSLDWKEIGPYYVRERVIRNSSPGSIVLFHSNINGVKYYLDDILNDLENKKYKIVPVSELIYKENYTIDNNGIQKINQ
ncbi:polysaccharide deacetylase family protein [Romboutsia sp.]|uniref:polysaccharide deacetylase family protein n=1 Tax=Romboutsia sp. TaxID=1965302 RepID=UPI003F37C2DC